MLDAFKIPEAPFSLDSRAILHCVENWHRLDTFPIPIETGMIYLNAHGNARIHANKTMHMTRSDSSCALTSTNHDMVLIIILIIMLIILILFINSSHTYLGPAMTAAHRCGS